MQVTHQSESCRRIFRGVKIFGKSRPKLFELYRKTLIHVIEVCNFQTVVTLFKVIGKCIIFTECVRAFNQFQIICITLFFCNMRINGNGIGVCLSAVYLSNENSLVFSVGIIFICGEVTPYLNIGGIALLQNVCIRLSTAVIPVKVEAVKIECPCKARLVL